MKKCPECQSIASAHLPFCGVCGSSLVQPPQLRRSRFLFFLTPFFLILIFVALAHELNVPFAVDYGMAIGGYLVIIYFISALVLFVLARVFKMPCLPQSYWQSGMFSVLHFIACLGLTIIIEPLITGDIPAHLGPQQIARFRFEALFMIFLPSWFAGILGVSARARFVRFPEAIRNRLAKFMLKHTALLLPFSVCVVAAVLYLSQAPDMQIVLRARLLNDLGARKMAAEILHKSLEGYENSALISFNLGKQIVESPFVGFDAETSQKLIEDAIRQKPGVAMMYYYLSLAHDLDKNGHQAVESALKAVELLPGNSVLWQYLGDLYLKYKNQHKAVEAYKKALELDVDNAVLLNNLAYTMLEINENTPLALELARQSVEKLPNMLFNLDTLAWAYYKSGRIAEALEIMNQIYSVGREVSPEIDFHYAVILYSAGSLNEPLKAFDKLLARPEVAADHTLFQQVYDARARIEKDINSSAEGETIKNLSARDETLGTEGRD